MRLVHTLALIQLCLCFATAQTRVDLTRVASGLQNPVDIQAPHDGSGRLFLVEQPGRIRILQNGSLLPAPFLDIQNRVASGGESGLLGLALAPGFPEQPWFYVNYTDLDGNTAVARYRHSGDPNRADPSSEQILLTIEQPFSNHNGGQLQFGPDGYLYIGTGDGGSGGDPRNNGQDRSVLLGKMLRIDVEPGLSTYRIPPDNPFVNDPAARDEIWALGLRNPWRYSFDRDTGDLWIGDVGQSRAEEISFQPSSSTGGENYGWRRMEGLQCFEGGCSQAGLTLPVIEYPRTLGVSVTGGYVYRGSASPGLRGTYVYGDFGSGRIWGLRLVRSGPVNDLLLDSPHAISSFGEDESGELYLASHGEGSIYRLDAFATPPFEPSQVGNAANFESGLTPGSASAAFLPGLLGETGVVGAASIPLPRTLAGVRVLVNGEAAPLYAVARANGVEQVNFQAPFSLAGGSNATVVIERDGHFTVSASVPVSSFQPASFMLDADHQLVVHASDNTLITPENPLRPGEYVYFYATGLGPVTNEPPAGSASPTAPLAVALNLPSVTVGEVPAEVSFAGLAPTLVGVYQVNIRIPDPLPGDDIAIR